MEVALQGPLSSSWERNLCSSSAIYKQTPSGNCWLQAGNPHSQDENQGWSCLDIFESLSGFGGANGARSCGMERLIWDIPFLKACLPSNPFLDLHYLSPQLCLLQKIDTWNFDVIHLEKISSSGAVVDLCMWLFNHAGLVRHFGLDQQVLRQTLLMIQGLYHSNNPYHNSIHAADVTQSVWCFINQPKILRFLEPVEVLAVLLAALCHDLEHPGVNQSYLLSTGHHLVQVAKALPPLRNVTPTIEAGGTPPSILEAHHVRQCLSVLHQTGLLINRVDWKAFVRLLTDLILATDMSFQATFIDKFQRRNQTNSLKLCNKEDRQFILQIALKCADICNTCRPWNISCQWSCRVTQEFFTQGDEEKKAGLPVNPFFDRSQSNISKIQYGFMSFVAKPLLQEWNTFCQTPFSASLLEHLTENANRWKSSAEKPLKLYECTGVCLKPSKELIGTRACLNRLTKLSRGVCAGDQTNIPSTQGNNPPCDEHSTVRADVRMYARLTSPPPYRRRVGKEPPTLPLLTTPASSLLPRAGFGINNSRLLRRTSSESDLVGGSITKAPSQGIPNLSAGMSVRQHINQSRINFFLELSDHSSSLPSVLDQGVTVHAPQQQDRDSTTDHSHDSSTVPVVTNHGEAVTTKQDLRRPASTTTWSRRLRRFVARIRLRMVRHEENRTKPIKHQSHTARHIECAS